MSDNFASVSFTAVCLWLAFIFMLFIVLYCSTILSITSLNIECLHQVVTLFPVLCVFWTVFLMMKAKHDQSCCFFLLNLL